MHMFKKGTKLYSVVNMKCPRCNEGDFFVSGPYDFKHVGETPTYCSECHQKYAKEPGFYYGAMYVSYAFGVALFVAIIVLYWLIFRRFDVWTLLITMGICSILTAPFFFHLSKVVWANIFIHYDKDAIQNYQEVKKEKEQKANEAIA